MVNRLIAFIAAALWSARLVRLLNPELPADLEIFFGQVALVTLGGMAAVVFRLLLEHSRSMLVNRLQSCMAFALAFGALPLQATVTGMLLALPLYVLAAGLFAFFRSLFEIHKSARAVQLERAPQFKSILEYKLALRTLGAFVILVLLFFAPVFTQGKTISPLGFTYVWAPFNAYHKSAEVPYNGIATDFADSMYPGYYMIYNAVHAGEGFPVSDRYALGPENNVTLLASNVFSIDFLMTLLFGPPWGMTIAILLRFILGGFATIGFLRLFKVGWLAALYGAVTLCFSGLSIVNIWLPYIWAMPVLFYCSELLIRRRTLGAAMLLTLGYYIALTTGQVIWSAHIILLQLLYCAVRIVFEQQTWRSKLRLSGIFIFAGLLAIGLTAFMILPSIEHRRFLTLEYRASAAKAFVDHALAIMFVFPRIAGDVTAPFIWGGNAVERACYFGAIPLLLTPLALFSNRSRIKYFFVGMSLLIFIVITNSFGILNLLGQLPIFDSSPSTRLRFLWTILAASAAAFGLDYLARYHAAKTRKLLTIALISAPIFCIYLLTLYNDKPYYLDFSNPEIVAHLWQQAIFLIIGAAFLLILTHSSRKNVAMACLIGLTFSELHSNYSEYPKYIESDLAFPRMQVTDYLQKSSKSDSRFIPIERSFISFFAMPYNLSSIQPRGFYTDRQKALYQLIDPDALTVHPTMYFFSRHQTNYDSPLFDLLNVRHLVMIKNLAPAAVQSAIDKKWKLVFDKELEVYENRDRPRPAILVSQAVVASGLENIVAAMRSEDLSKVVILEDSSKLWDAAALPQEPSNRSKLESFNNDYYRYRTVSNSNGYLVLSKFFHPAWHAYIDGRPAELLSADLALMALKVPKGKHIIELKFQPAGLKLGLWISALSFLSILLLSIYANRKRRI